MGCGVVVVASRWSAAGSAFVPPRGQGPGHGRRAVTAVVGPHDHHRSPSATDRRSVEHPTCTEAHRGSPTVDNGRREPRIGRHPRPCEGNILVGSTVHYSDAGSRYTSVKCGGCWPCPGWWHRPARSVTPSLALWPKPRSGCTSTTPSATTLPTCLDPARNQSGGPCGRRQVAMDWVACGEWRVR